MTVSAAVSLPVGAFPPDTDLLKTGMKVISLGLAPASLRLSLGLTLTHHESSTWGAYTPEVLMVLAETFGAIHDPYDYADMWTAIEDALSVLRPVRVERLREALVASREHRHVSSLGCGRGLPVQIPYLANYIYELIATRPEYADFYTEVFGLDQRTIVQRP